MFKNEEVEKTVKKGNYLNYLISFIVTTTTLILVIYFTYNNIRNNEERAIKHMLLSPTYLETGIIDPKDKTLLLAQLSPADFERDYTLNIESNLRFVSLGTISKNENDAYDNVNNGWKTMLPNHWEVNNNDNNNNANIANTDEKFEISLNYLFIKIKWWNYLFNIKKTVFFEDPLNFCQKFGNLDNFDFSKIFLKNDEKNSKIDVHNFIPHLKKGEENFDVNELITSDLSLNFSHYTDKEESKFIPFNISFIDLRKIINDKLAKKSIKIKVRLVELTKKINDENTTLFVPFIVSHSIK